MFIKLEPTSKSRSSLFFSKFNLVTKTFHRKLKLSKFNKHRFSTSKIIIPSLLSLLFLFSTNASWAQAKLNQAFRFENGIYLSFEAFQKNIPNYTGSAIEGNYFINKQTRQAKIEYVQLKETKEPIDLDKIWVIVIKGIPYIKTRPKLPAHYLKVFASLEVRGNICYYAYDDIEEKETVLKAYNPLIGKPFRKGKVKRKVPVIKEKILRFESGKIADFNYQNVVQWLSNDKEMVQALKRLGAAKAEDKLFDALLVYNEKYPVELK